MLIDTSTYINTPTLNSTLFAFRLIMSFEAIPRPRSKIQSQRNSMVASAPTQRKKSSDIRTSGSSSRKASVTSKASNAQKTASISTSTAQKLSNLPTSVPRTTSQITAKKLTEKLANHGENTNEPIKVSSTLLV